MTKGTISGILMIVIGGIMLVFQKISGLMGDGREWDAICLVDLLGPGGFDWIDNVTFLGINNLLDRIIMIPLYILLPCVGAVILIISGLKKD